MQCDEFLPVIEKLADGECSAVEKQRAETHLEACDSCRGHYEFLKALPEAARETPLPEPPGAYWEALPSKVMRRIDQERSGNKSLGWFPAWLAPSQLRWLAVVAAGLVVVVLSYEIMLVQEPKARVPEPPVSSGRLTPDDKDLPEASVVSKELVEQEKQTLDEGQRQEADESSPTASSEDRPQSEVPPALRKSQTKSDDRSVPRDRPLESPASVPVPEKGEAEMAIASLADEEAVVSREAAGKKAALSPAEPSDLVAEAPQRPQPASGEESKSRAQLAPSPSRGRPKLEANEATAVDRMAVTDRAQKTSYRRTLGGARELSEVEFEARCNYLRESLDPALVGEELLNARFDLAECSLLLAKRSPTEERLTRARDDVNAFLEISPQGDKAEKLKRELDALLEKK